jgi:hypothetical protein
MQLKAGKVHRGCRAYEDDKRNASIPADENLGDGKQEAASCNDQRGNLHPHVDFRHGGKKVGEQGRRKMDQNRDPAQHPQTYALLAITQVDPGKERHKHSNDDEYNDFFE